MRHHAAAVLQDRCHRGCLVHVPRHILGGPFHESRSLLWATDLVRLVANSGGRAPNMKEAPEGTRTMTQTLQRSLTLRARVVLATARGVAAGRGDTNVTATHIAIGLVIEGQSMAAAALVLAGVPLRGLRLDLEAELGPPPGPPAGDGVALALTPGEQSVVEAASDLSVYRHVGPEHLLMAILKDATSPTAKVFARYGFMAATAREHLEAIARATPADGAV